MIDVPTLYFILHPVAVVPRTLLIRRTPLNVGHFYFQTCSSLLTRLSTWFGFFYSFLSHNTKVKQESQCLNYNYFSASETWNPLSFIFRCALVHRQYLRAEPNSFRHVNPTFVLIARDLIRDLFVIKLCIPNGSREKNPVQILL